jgi:hypothetical protein
MLYVMGMLEAVDPGREEGEDCENEEFMRLHF